VATGRITSKRKRRRRRINLQKTIKECKILHL
jgi:hypothetical protein